MAGSRLIVGNWKMNGLAEESRERVVKLAALCKDRPNTDYGIVLCPPATLSALMTGWLQGTGFKWGGQDCHAAASGAFTGDISAPMLKDMGAGYVILGHSERRQYYHETSAQVAAKVLAAHAAGLVAIVCIGETDAERMAGQAERIVAEQLRESLPATATPENTVLAYEPVWAIGTGKVAAAEDVMAMHAHIRTVAGAGMKILYGGSVKAENAAEILHLPNVDGVLVGGASLKAETFFAIAEAAL